MKKLQLFKVCNRCHRLFEVIGSDEEKIELLCDTPYFYFIYDYCLELKDQKDEPTLLKNQFEQIKLGPNTIKNFLTK